MKDLTSYYFIGGSFIILLLLICAPLLYLLPSVKPWQREAVLKGHAIWAVDKDGAPMFQWKSEVEKK